MSAKPRVSKKPSAKAQATDTPPVENLNTYLSKRGYAFDKTPELEPLCIQLRKELTVKPYVNPTMPGAALVAEFPVYRESPSKFYVPRIYGLKRFGVPQVLKMEDGDPGPGLIFNGTLRPRQEAPVAAFMCAAVDPLKMGGIMELACAEGKTVMSLYIACQIKRKTLVIAHKEFLVNQWHERITQFVPAAKVGIIKQSKVVVDGMDIVLASLQSLAMRDYDEAIFSGFGLVIIDECHHTGAEVFSRALMKVNSKVMMGLSATVQRKDGLSKVFEWHIGAPVYTIRRREDPDVTIIARHYYSNDDEYSMERTMYNGKLNFAATITGIVTFEPRNQVILDDLVAIKKEAPARKVLVLSERRGHLDRLRELIEAYNKTHAPLLGLGTTAYYVGGMKEADLKKSEGADILLATYAMASEGMDIPGLDTLILASPVSSIEQPVGRILRQKPEDRRHIPLVLDVIDDFSLFQGQGRKRLAFYKKQGYCIRSKLEGEGATEPDTTSTSKKKPLDETCFKTFMMIQKNE